ncbi:hypothetical protein [Thiolapillus sp.]|uniref:hypothetical protein n=1 Tax=Thiolapillus sp. TaxID=2017437 RepID=UPI003AF4902B
MADGVLKKGVDSGALTVQALDDSPQVGAVVSIHHGHIIAPERQETRGMNKKRKPTP